MNKKELSQMVSAAIEKSSGRAVSQTTINQVIEALLAVIQVSLQNGERVHVRGFGTFGSRSRKARQARNPKTGEVIDVPSKRVPVLKFGFKLD